MCCTAPFTVDSPFDQFVCTKQQRASVRQPGARFATRPEAKGDVKKVALKDKDKLINGSARHPFVRFSPHVHLGK